MRLLILAILLLVAGANSVLNIRQFFFSERPYTGMTAVRGPGGITVQEVYIRDNLDRIEGIFDFADRIRMLEPGRT